MVAYNDRNFLVASIPVPRREVHLKKWEFSAISELVPLIYPLSLSLLSRGYRVGIVSQTETAALKKVGDNRNAPFDRKVTHLFTAATYV